MRILLFIIFTVFSSQLFSQDDSLRVIVNRVVLEPDLRNPNTLIETYIEINDSIDLFINNIQKQFGEIDEENGVFTWKKVSIDSVGVDITIVMYHGIWSTKNDTPQFKNISIIKTDKIKKTEKRGLRIRVYLKNGRDAMSSHKNELILVYFFENLLNISGSTIEE